MEQINILNYSSKKQLRTLINSGSIPLLFVIIAEGRRVLEYYFRFSKEYHCVYANGSFIGLLLQLLLLPISLALFIHLLTKVKQFSSKILWFGSLALAVSPLAYFAAAIMIAIL